MLGVFLDGHNGFLGRNILLTLLIRGGGGVLVDGSRVKGKNFSTDFRKMVQVCDDVRERMETVQVWTKQLQDNSCPRCEVVSQ